MTRLLLSAFSGGTFLLMFAAAVTAQSCTPGATVQHWLTSHEIVGLSSQPDWSCRLVDPDTGYYPCVCTPGSPSSSDVTVSYDPNTCSFTFVSSFEMQPLSVSLRGISPEASCEDESSQSDPLFEVFVPIGQPPSFSHTIQQCPPGDSDDVKLCLTTGSTAPTDALELIQPFNSSAPGTFHGPVPTATPTPTTTLSPSASSTSTPTVTREWYPAQYLKSVNIDAGDMYGHAISMYGNTALVGAPGEGSCATGVSGDQTNNLCPGAGAAWVESINGATYVYENLEYLKSPDTEAGDGFGFSTAIDEEFLIVGAPYEDACGGVGSDNSCPDSGAAYVFLNQAASYPYEARLKGSMHNAGAVDADDHFGWAVGATPSGSGNFAFVSAPGDDSCDTDDYGAGTNNGCADAGSLFIFRRDPTWDVFTYMKASFADAGDQFGYSIASDDRYFVAVGIPGEDSCTTTIDGSQSDNSCPDAGAVSIVWDQSFFMNVHYIKASNAQAGDRFGHSVALDGQNNLVVGAVGESSCSTTPVDGDDSNNGCASAGAVYIFRYVSWSWSQEAYLKAWNTRADAAFGNSLAWDSSGSTDMIIVGSVNDTSCGSGVSGDGNTLGCAEAGSVYVYRHDGSDWYYDVYLRAHHTNAGDQFGQAVAAYEDSVFVGAPKEDSCSVGDPHENTCPSAGAVYVFRPQGWVAALA